MGEGAFGSVYLAMSKSSSEVCAIKVLEKAHIMKFDKTKGVKREKEILFKLKGHPNIISLDCVFHVTFHIENFL